jgi:hypothetical protein
MECCRISVGISNQISGYVSLGEQEAMLKTMVDCIKQVFAVLPITYATNKTIIRLLIGFIQTTLQI